MGALAKLVVGVPRHVYVGLLLSAVRGEDGQRARVLIRYVSLNVYVIDTHFTSSLSMLRDLA